MALRARVSLATLVLLALAAGAFPGHAAIEGPPHTRPHTDAAITRTLSGELSSGYSQGPSITPDGRLVAFQSRADDLVPGDTNGQASVAAGEDVFLADTVTGTIERLSVGLDGAEPDERSNTPQITPDGRFVLFSTQASNLVPGDTNGRQDLVRLDRQSGQLELVSYGFGGAPADGHSGRGVLTPDGQTLVFASMATNILADPNLDGAYDVYVRDLVSGQTERIGSGTVELPTFGAPSSLDVSADGRHIAYVDSSNVHPGTSTARNYHVFVHDRQTGLTERVSTNDDGMDAEAPPGQLACPTASISEDGRFVAMRCNAPNLVPNDTNATIDVYVKDRATNRMERISVADDGRDLAWGTNPEISPDGRFVAFFSNAAVYGSDRPDQGVKPPDLYVHDRLAGTTDPIYQRTVPQNGAAWGAGDVAIGPGAEWVAYAAPLVGVSEGRPKNLYLQHRGRDVDVLDLSATLAGDQVAIEGLVALGPWVVSDVARVPAATADSTRVGATVHDLRLVLRPERQDLMVHVGVSSLTQASLVGGLPMGLRPDAVRYVVRFSVAGNEHRVVVDHQLDAGLDEATFTLEVCAPICEVVATLDGGLGTTGHALRTAIPLDLLAVSTGTVTDVEVTSARVTSGVADQVDALAGPDGRLPANSVRVGVGPTGVPIEGLNLSEVTVSGGAIRMILPVSPDDGVVWADACLDAVCATHSASLSH